MVSEQTRNAIIRLAGEGKRPRQIFDELKKTVSIGVVYKTLHEARGAGYNLPNFRIAAGNGGKKILTKQLITALSPYARARRCSVTDLARLLLERVTGDDLVEAVLDDRRAGKKGKISER